MGELVEERIVVLTPTGRDGPLTVSLLAQAGMPAVACRTMEQAVARLAEGGAALVLAQEALASRASEMLVALLERQPAWSDLPILLFAGHGHAARQKTIAALAPLGNVTLLDRPLRPITLVTAARSALRARRRQYAARHEVERRAAEVRERDQFLAMLGHELRNPLGTLMLAVEMLARTHDVDTTVTTMRRQGRHLTRMVDDLLDVARVTRGRIELQREELDLDEIIAKEAQGLSGRLHGRSLALHLAGGLGVRADPVRLGQVFGNLLTNAIKYTRDGGHIEVVTAVEGERAVVRVHDDGVGVSREMLPRLFDLFSQAEESLHRAEGGLGIGLTLVKSLVELHGGDVSATSAGPGQGSTFTVRLPLSTASPLASAGAGAAASAVCCARVLIVEDHDDARALMRSLVESFGCAADAVADGETAVKHTVRDPPDAMLVDIGLPGLDGYGVARAVREAHGARILLVAITGYGQPGDRERARQAGFDAHLTKPVEPDVLRRLLVDRSQ